MNPDLDRCFDRLREAHRVTQDAMLMAQLCPRDERVLQALREALLAETNAGYLIEEIIGSADLPGSN